MKRFVAFILCTILTFDLVGTEVFAATMEVGNLTEVVEENTSEEAIEPEESTTEEETVEPEESTTEEEVVEPEESTTEEEVVEPEESTTEEEVVEPEEGTTEEEVAEPEESTTEEEVAEPEESTTEEEVVEPEEGTTEEEVAEPEESTTEEEVVEPEESTTEEETVQLEDTENENLVKDEEKITVSEIQKLSEENVSLVEKSVTATAGCTAAELQALLDENANGEYQLTVNIPAGTYEMTAPLFVYANTTIKADANAILVKQSKYGGMIETKLIADDGGYDGNGNITIDGGVWKCNDTVKTGGIGTETFRFIHSNNIVVKNATFCDMPEGSHMIVFAGVQNATVTNCTFYDYYNWQNITLHKEAIQLDMAHSADIVSTNQADQIIWDDLPCNNITITECEFYNGSRGIGSHTAVAGRFHTNITITNNEFYNLSDSAVRLYAYKDTTVSNNTFNNVAEGVKAYTYIDAADTEIYFTPIDGNVGELPSDYNITISYNNFTNINDENGLLGDAVRIIGKDEGTDKRPFSGVEVTNNEINTTSRYGIFATAAPNAVISSNKITASVADSVLLEPGCHNSVISANTITDAKESGVSVYVSSNVEILNNTVSSSESAIYLLGATNCYVGKDSTTGNTVTSKMQKGISLSTMTEGSEGCTGTSVIGNTIDSAKEDGIFVYNTNKATVSNNTIVSAEQNGINVNTNSKNSNVSNNTISSAKLNGIAIMTSSSCAQVAGNTVQNYGVSNTEGNRYGIIIYQSAGKDASNRTVVTGNTIIGKGTATGKNAIQISESSYTLISKNIITTPDGTGIYLYKSKNCVVGGGSKDGNKVSTPTEKGIYLTTTCDGTKVQYNTVTSAKAEGVGVYSSKSVTINKNTVSSQADGINVNTNSTSNKITNNTITSAGSNGIKVSSKSTLATVTGNTIKKYSTASDKGAGIEIYQSGGTSTSKRSAVSSNTITGTGKGTGKPGIKVNESAYVLVSKNTVTTPDGTGIYLYKSKNCVVGGGSKDGNKVSTPTERGIYLTTTCDGTKVQYNTVTNSTKEAIGAYSTKSVNINKNTVSSKADGININTNCTSGKITNNTITSAGSNGIKVSSKSTVATVTGNTIKKYSTTSDKGAGIEIYQSGGTSTSKRSTVSSNTITGTGKGTGKPGIKVNESAYVLVSKNTVTTPDGTGIYLYKSKTCVVGGGSKDGNKVSTPTERGIYLTTTCDGTKVQYNTVTTAKSEAIGVYSSKSVTINKNTVSSKADGININTNSTSGKITNNTITSAGANGIKVSSKSTGVSISGNNIKKYATSSSDASGIYVYQSGGASAKNPSKITSNTITGSGTSTKKYGIRISDSRYMTIESNTLNSIPGTAIYVYKTKNCTTNKNTIKTPKAKGIYYTTTCDSGKITSNTVTKPADVAINIYKAPSTTISSNKVTVKSKSLKGIWVSTSNKSKVQSNTISGTTKKNAVSITSSTGCTNKSNTIK